MIQRQLKLRLTATQERRLTDWLWHLTGVWNWAIRKLELDARDGLYYSSKGFQNLLANHGKTLGIPSHTVQGMLSTAHTAWQRCFKKLAKRPRLKRQRNKLTSIPLPDPLKAIVGNTIDLPGSGRVRFHKQSVPKGRIKMGRVVKQASGWYLCLFIDATPQAIPHTGEAAIGIDPGFSYLLTLSNGEKVPHPYELRQTATINSRAVWWPKTSLSCGPKMAIGRSQKPLGRAWPVLDTLSFAACSPTSALQAVGDSSKSLPVSPPRPAQHVGASPGLLATPACK